jgi:hypothetical protein
MKTSLAGLGSQVLGLGSDLIIDIQGQNKRKKGQSEKLGISFNQAG